MTNIGRICLECEHCFVSGGHGHISDYTPTMPFEMVCFKEHDLGVGPMSNKHDMRKGIMQAATCKDFVEEKQP